MEQKRLLFINQHYHPDFASTGQHLTDLAEHLVRQGHEVTVICSGARYLSGSLKEPKRDRHNGVDIIRLRGTGFGRSRHLGRMADYFEFYVQVLFRLLFGRSYDRVIVLTTPPLLCFAAAIAKALRGQQYGIWSMDLHPDAEVELGMLRDGGFAARLLHWLNDVGYRNADFIVDLGSHMKRRLLNKGVSQPKLHTIPVWNKKDEIFPVPRLENPLLEQLGVEDRFVVMYSGNAGLAHRFEEVLKAMELLRNHDQIFFLFVGRGPRRKEIVSFSDSRGIRNFRYLDYFPREQLKYSLSVGHVHLLTLRNEMAGVAVPGKLYGIMAAERPVIMVGPRASEPAETILEHQAGVVVDPEVHNGTAPNRLADAFVSMCDDEQTRIETGKRGREAFLRMFEKEVTCEAWTDLIGRT